MNIQQLHIIREASRYDFNLTEVASVLGISQPAVSHQVRELEQELGITLFRRHGRRLLGLTPVGEEILTVVERLLQDIQTLLQMSKQPADIHSRPVHVAIQAPLASPAVVRGLQGLAQTVPQIEIHTSVSHAGLDILSKRLRDGELDMALSIRPFTLPADLTFLPCRQVGLQLLLPAGHPLIGIDNLNLFHLAAFPLIAPPDDDTVRLHISQAFRHAGLTEQVVLATSDPTLIRHYVEQELGIGVVPHLLERQHGSLVSRDATALFSPLELGLIYTASAQDERLFAPLIREAQLVLRQLVLDKPLRKVATHYSQAAQSVQVHISDGHSAPSG